MTKLYEIIENMFEFESLLYIERFKLYDEIIDMFNNSVLSYFASLGFEGTKWPVYEKPSVKTYGLTTKIENTVFTEILFSIFGRLLYQEIDIEKSSYYCFEKIASYFGLFYYKDISSVITHNVTIDVDKTKDMGTLFEEILSNEQNDYMISMIEDQMYLQYELYETHYELMNALYFDRSNKSYITYLGNKKGYIDMNITILFYKMFRNIKRTLNEKHRQNN
ncbi:hypothetical protein [Heterosigma akashiwo virus 01]|uniref:Uncharacterized protein n=1 Tax=Heterosigma akashiwo virus 01 TaxID=97195 RepID=A0A1C9C581_HAV01|nr:hypothetical protein D1R72_gp113 [Heterosigma akashiwo virus 01]AOM63444.1 hypothetical protein [Heterosigma akashiwo virus 01]